jgi:hypothetical protein
MRIFTSIFLGLLPFSSLFAQQAVTTAAPTAVHGAISTTQQRVDPTMTYHRVLAIVPLVGSGTSADPVRPMFAPTPQATPTHTGIIAYQHQLSDDGTLALVEFVAVDRSAFAPLFASTDSRVQYFEVGKSTPAQVQAAFQQKKTSFNIANFQGMPVR